MTDLLRQARREHGIIRMIGDWLDGKAAWNGGDQYTIAQTYSERTKARRVADKMERVA